MQTYDVTVGAGKVYVQEYTGTIPEDSALEAKANLKKNTSGGITFSYTSESTEIKNDLGELVDDSLSDDSLTVKFGLMSHDAADLKQLCGTASTSTASNTITTYVGGIENDDGKWYIVRFVHTNKAGKTTRYTLVGRSREFSLPYQKGDAMVADATFTAKHVVFNQTDGKKRLLMVTQEIPTA